MLQSIYPFILSFILNLDLANSLVTINKNLVFTNTILALKHCIFINLFLLHYYITNSLTYWNVIRIYSLGYLISDTLYFHVCYRIAHWKLYLLHHSIFILSWILIEYQPSNVYPNFIRMLLAELSAMTINIKYIAKHYNYSNLDICMSLLTYILFFIFRILNFTQMFWVCYQENNIIFCTLLIPLTCMQYYWFYMITLKLKNYIYKKLIKKY